MPKYSYECSVEDCEGKTEFVIEHSIKDDAHKFCPFCGKESLKRLIAGGTSFSLKGSCWYRDSYSR